MKKNICKVFASMIMSISLLVNIVMFEEEFELDFSIFYKMDVIVGLVLFILIFKYIKDYDFYKIRRSKKILAGFFSLCMILGESYVYRGTYKLIFTNSYTLFVSLIKFIGIMLIFTCLFSLLDELLKKLKNDDLKSKSNIFNKYLTLLKNHPFITSFITIFIFWSVYLIAFYPIVLSPDPAFQIKQYFGEHTKYIDWVIQRDPNVFITAHHPILQTYFLGWSIEIGRLILNDNFGLFIYTILQTIIYISVLSYTICFAAKNNVKTKYLFILLLIYLFVPMYGFYTVSAVKDTLYTAFMMLFVLVIFDLVKNFSDKKISFKYMIHIFFVLLSIGLFRHNGVYVAFITLPFLLFVNRKNILRLLIIFVLFFASITAFDKVLVPYLGISDGSVREMLSIPFQQTARLARENESVYSKKDKKIINKVLKYKTLSKRYNPELSDPVKNKFNKDATDEDLKEYFKVWYKHLFPNLDIYMDATMNNIYGFFYPNTHKWYVYSKFDENVLENNLIDYHYNELEGLRAHLTLFANIFIYIPIIGLISNIGFGTWVIFIMFVYLLNSKKKKYIVTLVPLFSSLLFCVVGPANTYFRYAMPYLFVIPVLVMLLLCLEVGEKNEKRK